MELPPTIRVKLSSEAAEYISVTQVVVREIPLVELVEQMLGTTGKNAARVRDILRRGSLVSGASRYRWQGLDPDIESVAALLATFPDSDPGRAFRPECCARAVLRGPYARIPLSREAAGARHWETLLALGRDPVYVEYAYLERADLYRAKLTPQALESLRTVADVLKHTGLREQIRKAALDAIDLLAER